MAARLEDEDEDVRMAAIQALQGQVDLSEEILQGMAARLKHKDLDVRMTAIQALQGRANPSEEILQGIAFIAALEKEGLFQEAK